MSFISNLNLVFTTSGLRSVRICPNTFGTGICGFSDLRRWCDTAQALQVVWLAAFSEFTSFKEAIRLLIITWNRNSKFKKLIRTFAGDSPKSMM